ncbi:hypothetical protein HOC01_04800 [archaeon]|jgi:RNA-binding protein YhbY|nr:hypothetical protein [archaeon]MBT6698286.1 hypothetical protein [archaeon]
MAIPRSRSKFTPSNSESFGQSASRTLNSKKFLKTKSKKLKPMLQIGKLGLTPNTLKHIKTLVQKHKLIKIKLLRSFKDEQKESSPDKTAKELAQELADKVNARLIDNVGLTIALAKKNL